MIEQEAQKSPENDIEKIRTEFGHLFVFSLAKYQEHAIELQTALEQRRLMDEFIELVNNGGLPEGHVVITNSSGYAPKWAYKKAHILEDLLRHNASIPEHANKIYRPSSDGAYTYDGELYAESTYFEFHGDRIERLADGTLIIVNTQHQIGVTPGDTVDVADITDKDPYRGRPYSNQRFTEYLSLLEQVRGGEKVHIDCSY